MADFIRVDEWEPLESENIVGFDGKIVIIPFDEIYQRESASVLNKFIIKKESYSKKLNKITHYINYFIKFYDHDMELIHSYFKLKFQIDESINKRLKKKSFIKTLYTILFGSFSTLREKIERMVEDNYHVNVSKKDPNSTKKYPEALEFTNDHAKVMMKISVSMNLMVPVIFHYINMHNADKELMPFYDNLFSMYGADEGINIYNKLWNSIRLKVSTNHSNNKVIWEQREIKGTSELQQTNFLLEDKIISETFFKYSFEKNIINLNSVVLEKQLNFFRMEKYTHNPVELSNEKDMVEGLSGLDKLAMSLEKVDESLSIISEINIKQTIKQIKKKMRIKVTKAEIDYYIQHHKISQLQIQILFNYFANHFNGFRDLNMLTRRQVVKLLVLLKKALLLQNSENIFLPHILTANVVKLNTRTIQNNKFLTKIQTSATYRRLVDDKFNTIDQLKKDNNIILNMLSTMINTTFTIVDYDKQDKTDELLDINPDILSDEFLDLLNQM